MHSIHYLLAKEKMRDGIKKAPQRGVVRRKVFEERKVYISTLKTSY